MRKNTCSIALFLLSLVTLLPAANTNAEVIVHDMIALKDKPTMLMAETKGRFFSKGGEVVDFFIDGKSIGRNLSGGDGFVFKQFTPAKRRLYRIIAESGGDKDEGLLLSLKRGDSIVFIDVEGSVLGTLFSMKPKKGSQKAIKQISALFPVVYLQTGILGIRVVKKWLKENGFQEAPLIRWRQGAIFDEIKEDGLKIRAIIAGPSVIESAKQYKPRAFSFDDVEGAEEVKDWEEIVFLLTMER